MHNDEQQCTFTLHISNIVKKAKTRWDGVQSVSVAEALSHADTLEISCHSPTRVYTAASSGIHGKQKTYKLSKLFNERLRTKSLKYGTGKDCTNSNCTLFRDAVYVI